MILEKIKKLFQDGIIDAHEFRGDKVVVIRKDFVVELMKYLKADPALGFNMLIDLSAVDYLAMERKPRFDVVYHLKSLKNGYRLRVKAGVDEDQPEIDSITSLWPIANWFEREAWDMFGIQFKGHPNLKRILMYEGFQGYPLRKDYPYNKRQPLIGPRN